MCWIQVLLDGTLACATGAAVVVGFAVAPDGQLDPLTTDAVAGRMPEGSMLLDLDASRDDRFLYVLEGATGAIAAFRVNADGSLTGPTMTPTGATTRLQGLAAF